MINPKQELFIKHYLICFNATESATKAGYSEKTAYSIGQRLLKQVEIKQAIDKEINKTSQKLQVTKEGLINDLLDIKDMAKDNTKVQHNAIKAIEVICKMLGYNEPDKTDITTNGKDILPTITLNIVPPKNAES